MTQEQINKLFGVAPSTIKEWKSDSAHRKHKLAIYLTSLNYEKTEKIINKLLSKKDSYLKSEL